MSFKARCVAYLVENCEWAFRAKPSITWTDWGIRVAMWKDWAHCGATSFNDFHEQRRANVALQLGPFSLFMTWTHKDVIHRHPYGNPNDD